MLNNLKEWFGSKKMKAFAAGMAIEMFLAFLTGTGKFQLELAPDIRQNLMEVVFGLTSAYVVGQGIADHGKEKAKIEAANGDEAKP